MPVAWLHWGSVLLLGLVCGECDPCLPRLTVSVASKHCTGAQLSPSCARQAPRQALQRRTEPTPFCAPRFKALPAMCLSLYSLVNRALLMSPSRPRHAWGGLLRGPCAPGRPYSSHRWRMLHCLQSAQCAAPAWGHAVPQLRRPGA